MLNLRRTPVWLRTGAYLLMLTALIWPAALTVQTGAASSDDPYVPDEVVVKLFNAGDLGAVARANGLDPRPAGQFGSRPIFRLRILDGSDPRAKASALRPASGSGGDARIQYAEPNYLTQTPEARRGRTSWVIGEDVGGYATQWAPAAINLPAAHTITRGAGIVVAVLDTGIDPNHPALRSRLLPGFDFVDFDNDPREEGRYGVNPGFGHGTHVAGLIALSAPQARILPIRVLNPDGEGNIWVLAEGLLYAVERGADGQPLSGDEARVINLSLGTLRRTNLLDEIVAEVSCASRDDDDDDDEDDEDDDDDNDDNRCARTGGAVIIAAAGNEGSTRPHYPAAEGVDGLLAVAASGQDNRLAAFSSYGSWVDIAAPGVAIISTVPEGGYATWSGTSMAAPLVAGAAALVRAADPGLRAPEVAAWLRSAAAPLCADGPPRLDSAAALGLPGAQTVCTTQIQIPLVGSGS
ncbi:MAG: S8 family serine peptidase [Chloroflexaceae bacterium]